MTPLKLLVLLLLITYTANALKFLIYNPKAIRSRVVFMNKLIDIFVDGGHEVVVYMPEVHKGFGSSLNPKKGKIIERPLRFNSTLAVESFGVTNLWELSSDLTAIWNPVRKIFQHFVKTCDQQLKDTELLDYLRNESFDLGVTEFYDLCGVGLFEKIGLNKKIIVHVNAMDIYSGLLGLPNMIGFVPAVFAPEQLPLSFWGRVKAQIVHTFGTPYIYRTMFEPFHAVYKQNGINSTFYELVGRSSFWYTNTDELVNFPGPISHKIVEVAGAGLEKTVKKSGRLDSKFRQIFDNSTTGVVYVSFGGVVKSSGMPVRIKRAFVETFKAFPHIDFIWKYETPNDGTIERLPNVHLESWLPQLDILSQKKLLAFVNHGGVGSVTEASYFGIPMICIPLLTDTPRTSLTVEYRQTAIIINKHNVTKESLIEGLEKIITDRKYRRNAKNLARMIAQKPMKVDERVLKYAEFAAKFESVIDQFDLPGRKMNMIEFWNLDVFALIFLCSIVVFWTAYKLLVVAVILMFKVLSWQSGKKKID